MLIIDVLRTSPLSRLVARFTSPDVQVCKYSLTPSPSLFLVFCSISSNVHYQGIPEKPGWCSCLRMPGDG